MDASSSSLASSIRHRQLRIMKSRILCLFLFALIVSPALNAQSSNETIVARVNNQNITLANVDETVTSQIYALQQQLFAIRKTALENLITKTLVESEATRQKLSIDRLKAKWMEGPVTVDSTKVTDLYQKNASAFGLMNPDEAKEKLRLDLEAQARLKKYRDTINALRQSTRIEILLDEPRMALTPAPKDIAFKGAANAKVFITEFSDFQCPFCKEVQTNLGRVLEKYAADVRLEFRNLPIETHPFANLAARAAYCGGQQGAFWPFHDELFRTNELSEQTIRAIAHNLKLNTQEFETCLSTQDTYAAIAADLKEARRLGINGTPSFIINGKLLLGAPTVEEFDRAIQQELSRSITSNLNVSK